MDERLGIELARRPIPIEPRTAGVTVMRLLRRTGSRGIHLSTGLVAAHAESRGLQGLHDGRSVGRRQACSDDDATVFVVVPTDVLVVLFRVHQSTGPTK